MQFAEAELIYVAKGATDSGSPIELTLSRKCRAKETYQFGLNYYRTGNVKQRIMQKSKNIVVPLYMTKAIEKDGVVYDLFYVNWRGNKYRVYENLKYFKSDLYRILDLQELN